MKSMLVSVLEGAERCLRRNWLKTWGEIEVFRASTTERGQGRGADN